MPVKQRDRGGLIPSSCAKIAQPRLALRDCRQYQQLNNYFCYVSPCVHTFSVAHIHSFSPTPTPQCSSFRLESLESCKKRIFLSPVQAEFKLCFNLNVLHIFHVEPSEGTTSRNCTFSTVTEEREIDNVVLFHRRWSEKVTLPLCLYTGLQVSP